MKESEGRQIHAEAVHALEHEQDLVKGLALVERATIVYIAAKDYQGAGEIQGVRMSIFKRYYRQTQDPVFLDIILQAANDAVHISKRTGDERDLAIPKRDLGKAYIEAERYADAVEPLVDSLNILRNNPPQRFDWDAVRAEVQAHLGFTQYMAGDKDAGRTNLDEAIEILKKEERSYEVDVWLSGAYMRGAQMLQSDEPATTTEYMQMAQEIIDSNPELKPRKEDWEKLNERLGA
jgi:tetratricopeptide (TPR) repeat protein